MKIVSLTVFIIGVVQVWGAKRTIHPVIKLCKRNDPNISDCFKQNFINLIPVIKDGYTPMNIMPIDPVQIDHIRMDFTQSKSVKMVANLNNVKMYGLSNVNVKEIAVKTVPEGLDMFFDLYFPKAILKSAYKAVGNFLLLNIDTAGEYYGEYSGISFQSIWNTTKYTKNNKEHLEFQTYIRDLKIDKIYTTFTNLIPNNTELTDNINNSINENVDVLYDEIKPVILETLRSIALNAINNVYKAFPYEVLYPLD